MLAARARRDSTRSPIRFDIDPLEETRRTPVAFTTAGGAALRVDFTLEHVISLKRNIATAVRIEPMVTHLGSGKQISARAVSRCPTATPPSSTRRPEIRLRLRPLPRATTGPT
jgi:hypothetical protein